MMSAEEVRVASRKMPSVLLEELEGHRILVVRVELMILRLTAKKTVAVIKVTSPRLDC